MYSSNMHRSFFGKEISLNLTLLIIPAFLFTSESYSQVTDQAWGKYSINSSLDTSHFLRLTKKENELYKGLRDVEDNMARLTLFDSCESVENKNPELQNMFAACMCYSLKDTIYVTSIMGFFAGLGVSIVINKEDFYSKFFEEADGTEIFKVQKDDTTYSDKIFVFANQQKMSLFKKPSLTNNETVIGNLVAEFKPFYELKSKKLIERKYRANIYFRCTLRVVPNSN